MKKFLNEFKEFIMRGNVLDLAVAVLVGAAFQSIVTSLTDNIISPVIGLFTRMNFDQLSVQIPYTDVIIKYGAFITSVINFLIMALIIFLIVKVINKIMTFGRKKEEQTQEETTKECPYCKSEISIEATRCPHCTSKLEGYNGQD
ncbi:large conductance mechanosensitive channel protein MscL [Oscillospiraceae bacterium LCP25S3_E10]|nr:large conductance mechanosensitive channel protein MscL [Ruminococcus sp.]MDD6446594.1 large conductance mechanosensitive channel protein MscL [Ruminococcus sp.]MDY2856072.1 large conductance mechanosensitive channel protein MscL [Oscillospiraceae bacterium]